MNDEKLSTKIKGGGFFGSSHTFAGVIKKTKISEASLIKNYESMERATKEYNKSFKEHLSNLNTLDDYANFDGMKNLFQKVIMKEVITQGAKVDTSMPLLFRNYHIEKEPTPHAFRREHILNQVRYILETSFAGREHMLIKNMSVEIGKSQFILHITTIENLKKSRTLDHTKYVIDSGGTRAALKDILSSTKKNLRRRTALVEIGRRSSSKSSSSSKSNSSSRTRTRRRTKKNSYLNSNSNSNSQFNNIDIGNSKKSISSLAKHKKRPSNSLPSIISTKSFKFSSKQSKPSIYKRPSEKRPPTPPVPTPPTAPPTSPTQPTQPTQPLPPPITGTQFTNTLAEKKQDLLQPNPNPFQPISNHPTPKQPIVYCSSHTDKTVCESHGECFWSEKNQRCGLDRNKLPQPQQTPPQTQLQQQPMPTQTQLLLQPPPTMTVN